MPFGTLWLPVVVSTVAVFVLSSISHMLLKHHKHDYRGLPNEEAFREVVQKGGAAPGVYFVPYCGTPSQMKDPAVMKKYTEGPVAMLTLMRHGAPALGKHLLQWALLCLLISFTAAYVARHSLSLSTDGLTVMRITGTVAFVGYAYGYFQDSIWKGIPWANSLRGIADAVVYAVATGLVFRLLWPAA
ncbi:MAG: hypothetical protein LAO51_03175 [Acidobacteriia bacterium]|nr:hypothetical protein [Terriglobia bacterium]